MSHLARLTPASVCIHGVSSVYNRLSQLFSRDLTVALLAQRNTFQKLFVSPHFRPRPNSVRNLVIPINMVDFKIVGRPAVSTWAVLQKPCGATLLYEFQLVRSLLIPVLISHHFLENAGARFELATYGL